MQRYRIYIIITAAILLLLATAFLLYFFIIRPFLGEAPPGTAEPGVIPGLPAVNEAEGEPGVDVPINGALPTEAEAIIPQVKTIKEQYGVDEVASGDLTLTDVIAAKRIEAPTIAPNGRGVAYHDPDDGLFYRQLSDGSVAPLSEAKFFSVEEIDWSPDSTKAVLSFPDDSKILYDFQSQTKLDLPAFWEDFDFSPTSDQIAFKSLPGDYEDKWIIITDTKGRNILPVEHLGDKEKDVQIIWAQDKQRVALYSKPLDGQRRELLFIGANGENFKSAFVPGLDVKGQWTPDGEKLLFSSHSLTDGIVPHLYVMDGKGLDTGTNRIDLNVSTWVDRCVIAKDSKIAYCGVPTIMRDGAAITPEYQHNTQDQLYAINLETGVSVVAARTATIGGAISYTISNPFLSPDEKIFYFQDADAGTLHALQIAE